MRAEQFIKDHGVEKARAVVEGAPEGANHFVGSTYLKLTGAVWWSAWLSEWSHKDNSMVKRWKCESIELIKTWGDVFKLYELKRLVESVDLVQHMGGIEALKGLINMINSPFALNGITRDGVFYSDEQIKELVKDYESIYGEEGASHE